MNLCLFAQPAEHQQRMPNRPEPAKSQSESQLVFVLATMMTADLRLGPTWELHQQPGQDVLAVQRRDTCVQAEVLPQLILLVQTQESHIFISPVYAGQALQSLLSGAFFLFFRRARPFATAAGLKGAVRLDLDPGVDLCMDRASERLRSTEVELWS